MTNLFGELFSKGWAIMYLSMLICVCGCLCFSKIYFELQYLYWKKVNETPTKQQLDVLYIHLNNYWSQSHSKWLWLWYFYRLEAEVVAVKTDLQTLSFNRPCKICFQNVIINWMISKIFHERFCYIFRKLSLYIQLQLVQFWSWLNLK